MIDNLALAISHGLMLLAAWLLLKRPDLDDDDAPQVPPTTDAARRRGRGRTGKDRTDA